MNAYNLLKKLNLGIWVKTLGYWLVGGGIIVALVSETFSHMLMSFGVVLVVAGWIVIYKVVKQSKAPEGGKC
jgi:hypothetical protein